MRGQRGRLPVQALGYVNSTEVIFGLPKTAGVRFRLSRYMMIRQFRNGDSGEMRFVIEELVFLDGENKVRDIFSQLLGNKMANSDHGNAVPNGQQKHQNVPAGYVKVLAAVIDYALWRFSNGVYKPMDFDIDHGNDDEIFSSHWRKKVYIKVN